MTLSATYTEYSHPTSPDSRAAEQHSSPSKLEGVGGSVPPTLPPPIMAPTNYIQSHSRRVKNVAHLKSYRRQLRNHSTKAEKSLWNWLKQSKVNNLKFRRQYSIDCYILDFYCPLLKLAIELDGDYHYHGGMVASDAKRDFELWNNYGIKVMRFQNQVVFHQPMTIINAIIQFTNNANNTPPPPPPNLGGEQPQHDTDKDLSPGSRVAEQHSSPSKLEGVGGSVSPTLPPQKSLHPALITPSPTSPNLGGEQPQHDTDKDLSPGSRAAEQHSSPSKLEGVGGSVSPTLPPPSSPTIGHNSD